MAGFFEPDLAGQRYAGRSEAAVRPIEMYPPTPEAETQEQPRRRRRRRRSRESYRRRRRRLLLLRLAMAGSAAVIAALVLTIWLAWPAPTPELKPTAALVPIAEPSATPIPIGGQKLILEGGPKQARQQGFRDCGVRKSGDVQWIDCHRSPAQLLGLPAERATVTFANIQSPDGSINTTDLHYKGVSMVFADLDGSMAQLKQALRRAGWIQATGLGQMVYHHAGLPAALTLRPDYERKALQATITPIALNLAEARIRRIKEERVEQVRRDQQVRQLLDKLAH
ncbi:hypothetical protein [Sphingomonas sp.]|uniref:hypothetical protein n=1 Tax=Sphingomonas sp. TaxID=28214 RepID=UPI003B3A5BF3